MEGVCKMYEEHLKKMNSNSPSITYDISQLSDFIDDLADLSCIVYRADTQTYQPYDKDWIKEKIYVLFHRQAQQAGTFGSIRGMNTGVYSGLLCKFCIIVILFPFWYTLARTECIR